MGSILALISSVSSGSAAFLSGYSARRVSIGYVMAFNQVPALAITGLLALLVHGHMTGVADRWWSAAAGLSIAISLPALYMALGIDPMAVVAPVTALIGIVLPVLFGVLVTHERPPLYAYLGFLLGTLAVVIVSGAEHGTGNIEHQDRLDKGLLLAVAAGCGIAATYICLKQLAGQPLRSAEVRHHVLHAVRQHRLPAHRSPYRLTKDVEAPSNLRSVLRGVALVDNARKESALRREGP